MTKAGSQWSDLVLGMTLAEVFLLCLFIVWLSSRAEGGGLPICEEKRLQCEQDLAERDAEITRKDEEITRLRKIEDWYNQLKKIVGFPPSDNPPPEAIANALRRGKRACDEKDNLLVVVTAVDGKVEVRLRQNFESGDTYEAGQVITGAAIDRFLAQVRKYADPLRCAYDFQLRWATDSDYRENNIKFNGTFFPANPPQERIPYGER